MPSDYEIGKLAAQVQTLIEEVAALRVDVKEIRLSVEDVKLWRAQLFGVSIAVSFIGSAIFYSINLLWK